GKDVGAIKGDFSYPFDLSMTATNRATLGYPDRLDNASRPAVNLPAQLYIGPDLLINGQLNVMKGGRRKSKVFLVNQPLSDLSKVKMNETDQGLLSFDNAESLRTRMRQTVDSPLNFDYTFFPVYNYSLDDPTNNIPTHRQFQNSWEFNNQRFSLDAPITPFIRNEVALRKAVEGAGYTWVDRFHTTNERKRMVLVNNRTMWTESVTSLNAPLNSFLPGTTVSEFLKTQCRLFCLAPFSNLTGDRILLQQLRSIVAAEPKWDWTNYAGKEYGRENLSGGVNTFAYPQSAYTKSYKLSNWSDLGQPDIIINGNQGTNQEGPVYYDPRNNTYIRFFDNNGTLQAATGNGFGAVENEFGDETIEPSLFPLQTNQILFYPSQIDNLLMGTWATGLADLSTLNAADRENRDEVSVALSIYRGLQNTSQGIQYPFGSMSNYLVDLSAIPGEEFSLRWSGPNSVYLNQWLEWDAMLQRGSAITRSFLLPIAQIIDFDFANKVRVFNQNFFVRSLEFVATARGISPAKCELLSVS
ncbi:MAG: hypothetical protein AAFU03_12240, partial [Bacteroidota bacterium]